MSKEMRSDKKGLLWAEWAMLGYTALTLVLMAVLWDRLVSPVDMLAGRAGAVLTTLALWGVYRRWPCRLTMFVRVAGLMAWLGWWYPDTYELNRVLPNLDHLFASAEQWLFGCQPALVLPVRFPQPVVSELLSLGYVSYYPLIVALVLVYFFRRYERFTYAVYVVMASFFIFYVVFDLLPVAGPQFYYEAVGCDLIAQGQFPDLGLYFRDHQESLPIPGWNDGLFYDLLVDAHNAGERPTAAFPSSHVGITTVLLWLAWEVRSRWLLAVMAPLAVLMFFATFYIQAHYAIDAIAGLFAGTAFYFVLRHLYRAKRAKVFSEKHLAE